jgi:PadR family transcriptional regulator PadR
LADGLGSMCRSWEKSVQETPALIPAFSPEEKVNRQSLRRGVGTRLQSPVLVSPGAVRGCARSRVVGSSFYPLDIHSSALYNSAMLTKELVAASTEPLILSLLSKGESYGYALIQEVKQLSGDKIEWTDGMLYPVLHRMEDNGWIKSRWVEVENGRKRKYYSIKKDGQQALKEKREQWTLVSSVLSGLWKEKYV